LQQHRPSNSKAIAYRQIFQQYKGKLIDFMLIYYTASPVLQIRLLFPFDLANNKPKMVSSIIFDAPFKKSSRVSHPFLLAGYHHRGFKWNHPASFNGIHVASALPL
jgi:hypothetical protein